MRRTVVFCLLVACDSAHNLIIKDIGSKEYKDVHTDKGKVRGFVAEDGDYFAFFGIPYAAPLTGRNRFKAPIPANSWNDTLEATRKVKCAQDGEGEEDCLIINVFSPRIIKDTTLPVLVFFHGGSYIMGSGYTSGFSPLMKKDIIVVTVNYRLGALGFLCLGIEEAPGNAGLKDQVAALKWVQRNIVNFGGNRDEITIYGMSAGGASVELLVFSNLATDLFKKAIAESSSAISVYSTSMDPIQNAVTVAKLLGFHESKDLKELAKFYQEVSAKDLSSASFKYYSNNTNNGNFVFVPCVEKPIEGIDPFITESPLNILSKGKFGRVPMMFSFTTVEGLFLRSEEFYKQNYRDKMNANFSNFIPHDLVFDTNEIKNQIASNIKQFYFGNESVSEDTLLEYLNFFGDYYVLYPVVESAKLHAATSNQPVYLLEFSYRGNMGSKDHFYDNIKFAGHGDIVKHAILINNITSTKDEIAVERMATIIANFAKFGNPLPEQTLLLDKPWPPLQAEKLTYLFVDNDIQILEDPYPERIKIWDELYKNYRQQITPVDPDLNCSKA